ncbi:MAG: response regulator transcription factor, partial [Dehalococcoidia bacterium]|nr:response regulator transcription factor [Dehalococcoidia bacterium]
MNVLAVDNDEMTCALVKFLLEAEGFSVSMASSPGSADRLLESKAYHVVLLDMQFNGDGSGLQLCHTLREQEYQIPIIFMTARNEVADRVAGFKAGADDCIAKPFDPSEFVARVKAVFRRYNHELQNSPIKMGRLKLNVQELKVTTAEGREVALTPTEMRLLRYLLLNTGRTVTRESLMNSIWGFDYEGESNPVDVYIRRLRKKIENEPSRPEFLLTV